MNDTIATASTDEIGIAVKRRREELGMKQATLAERAGLAERTVQRLESGRRVDERTLVRVAAALGMPVDSLLKDCVAERALMKVPAVGSIEVVPPEVRQEETSMMKRYFEEMVTFDRWANEQLLSWMERHPENPELTRIFAHVVAENQPWLHVLRGEVVPEDVHPEPDWTLAQCRANFAPTMDALAAYVASLDDASFSNIVRSSSPAGMTFENTVLQVLTNLLGHAEHHRGQMVATIGGETGEYVPTVYMSWLRCRG